jgi:CheY-like chemotaxis protein
MVFCGVESIMTAQNTIKVLVVEDEVRVRMDIVISLEEQGFIVVEAATADEAIDLLGAHSDIRILFTDIDMPGSMDGLKLAAAVRDRWPPVKIIVTSGHRQMSDEMLPVSGRFFGKPYDHSKIIQTIREMTAAA